MSDVVTRADASLSRAESDELQRRRRGRNVALMLVLLGVCGLFYLITLAKLAGH
ncbi:protein of unknown function [Rhodovastum atsumiense]|uniref:hypothetical protein n=1 Tax=Rhodovastum atsumiense TaxID=504468 RepID=UPI00139F2CD7|nr:hypothetical protein [Rhodovastum atsumiense]CAH2600634.1 protein of unknown function [Rhodovastum atsumiense]